MKKKNIALLIAIVLLVAAVVSYFAFIYKSPEQLRMERYEMEQTLQEKKATLLIIEEYLALREKQETTRDQNDTLSDLQDRLTQASDGLITYAKNDYVAFDRAVKAFRTIIAMEIDEINEELNK